MQQMEMFSNIKMWPKGLNGNNGYTTLQIYGELAELTLCSASPVVVLVYQLIAG